MSSSNTPHDASSEKDVTKSNISGKTMLWDRQSFDAELKKFLDARGAPIDKIPIFDHKELDIYQLFKSVIEIGGFDKVVDSKRWRKVITDLDVDPERTDAGFRLRVHYTKYLLDFEREFVDVNDLPKFVVEESAVENSKSSSMSTRKRKTSLGNGVSSSSTAASENETNDDNEAPVRRSKRVRVSRDRSKNDDDNEEDAAVEGSGKSKADAADKAGNASASQSSANKKKSKNGKSSGSSMSAALIDSAELELKERKSHLDFESLDRFTLREYQHYFQLNVPKYVDKTEVAASVAKHFQSMEVNEEDVIRTFCHLIRPQGPSGADGHRHRRKKSRR